jgi:diguanylate cyclase (GGDEF)-like protein
MTTFYYYTAVIYAAAATMLILSLIVRRNQVLTQKQKQYYIAACIFVILGGFCEWLAYYLGIFRPEAIGLQTAAKFCEFVLVPGIPLFGSMAITERKLIPKLLAALAAINLLTELVSLFNGMIFFVDAHGIYHHGSLYVIYMAIYIVMCGIMIAAMLLFLRDNRSTSTGIILLVVFFLAIGLTIQSLVSDVRMDYLISAISLTLYYIVFTDVIQSTDSLTGMRNRSSYDTRLSHLEQTVTIFSCDLDAFKLCNDTFGHLYGDKCLRTVGKSFREACPQNATAYRVGGDEFAVIQKGAVDPQLLIRAVEERMEEYRTTDPCLPYLSFGHALFEPGKTSVASVVEEADAMMYEEKARRKADRSKLEAAWGIQLPPDYR